MNSELSNFNLICRTCLAEKPDLKPIFESDAATMLNECQFAEVFCDDGLPHNVCTRCHDVLVQSYKFKKQCEESQMTLKRVTTNDRTVEGVVLELLTCSEEKVCKDESGRNFQRKIKKHACIHCSKKCSSIEALKRHSRIHKKKLKCSDCDETFRNRQEFKDHSCAPSSDRAFESDKEDSKPPDIPEDFTSFLDAELPPPLPFPCSDCSQSFNARCDLDLHLSTHTNSSEFICNRCKKQFATRQMLKRHVKTHMLHKPHICQECGKGFAESHALTKHQRKHTGQPREKRHLCTVCGQGFSEPFYLNVHMRKHTGERPLMCSACGKSFADPRSLKAHNMTHTGERPYKCNICDKAFSQSVNLTKHIRVHTGEKPYICSECGKRFTQSSSLDKHSRTHTGEKPYTCEQCPKRFAEKGTLTHHTRTHTGEKPYVCAHCGKCFASSSELKLHDRKHTGIKKNVCDVCGKDFATPSNLLVHSRTHSGEKPFGCVECGRAFADKGSLKKHAKIHMYKYGDVDVDNDKSVEENCAAEQDFATLNLNTNLDTLHTVIERNVDIGLSERLYFDLA